MKPLQRKPEWVQERLIEREDGSIYTTVPCKIQVPERYLSRHLASIGTEVNVLGFFAIIMEDRYYGVSTTLAMMRLTPHSTETVTVQDTPYLEFHFEAGDTVFASTELVKNDTLTYYVYDEFVAKGRIPWFYNYFDLARLFETAQEHAGINLGNRAILDLIISTIARNPDDYTQLYRHILERPEQVTQTPPAVVPFRSVIWNTSDTTSKLIGAYPGDALTSALVNPSESVERIEQLLRT